jgi:hypothetical protein
MRRYQGGGGGNLVRGVEKQGSQCKDIYPVAISAGSPI